MLCDAECLYHHSTATTTVGGLLCFLSSTLLARYGSWENAHHPCIREADGWCSSLVFSMVRLSVSYVSLYELASPFAMTPMGLVYSMCWRYNMLLLLFLGYSGCGYSLFFESFRYGDCLVRIRSRFWIRATSHWTPCS
ncbi:hypothetical protein N657DRAFT_136315 [Parathielavia appendiculata]|uniref:Uncharacterized protein n=1 Tax=Parathielavia appendiculata TaxID=2587402 RepID=A0AAN6TUV4_9PEZI|nr:hypothetical protein N657DRAFT_136315 [Parathielavia appendiculata]